MTSRRGQSTTRHSLGAIPFEVGQIYNRQRDIHAVYRGQKQGGISTPNNAPLIFLFTGEAGEQYGYKDGWTKDGVFLYTGEGQIGDMHFARGNKAIRDHAADGKDLLLFESIAKGNGYRYLGQFACASWEIKRRPDKLGNTRQIIVFHFVRPDEHELGGKEEKSLASISLEQLRQKALEATREASEQSAKEARRSWYERSEAVRAYVLARAAGICEACRKPAPFLRPDRSPYLEPHHSRRLSDGGPDDPRWVAAVCPNCHREVHYGAHGEALNRKLQTYLTEIESH